MLHELRYKVDSDEARTARCYEFAEELQVELVRRVALARSFLRHADPEDPGYWKQRHAHRRIVAGYHQAVDLMKQGHFAFMAAIADQCVIFEGHR